MSLVVRLFKDRPTASIPEFGTEESAGADLSCAEGFSISPGETRIVDTGLIMQPPPGFRLDIRPRSGLAAKFGISVLNTPGTIDRDYCGPEDTIKIILHMATTREVCLDCYDSSDDEVFFEAGDRIAQVLLTPTFKWEWCLQTAPNFATMFNRGGLGSTGINIENVTETSVIE